MRPPARFMSGSLFQKDPMMTNSTTPPVAAPRTFEGIHLAVATPCFGGNVSSLYAMSLLNFQLACIKRRLDVSFQMIGGDALITRARNVAVQRFLANPDATHFMFIDADIGFAPEQVFALLEADKDVSGAIYPLKRIEWDRVRAQARAGIDQIRSTALNYVVDLLGDPPELDGDMVRVHYLGTGFMMVKRAVFERMAEQYPEIAYGNLHVKADQDISKQKAHAFFDCLIDPESGTYLSEDYTFCKRWGQMGGTIWANTKSRLTHVGAWNFEGDVETWLKARQYMRTLKKP